jgi:hypothetical protein
VSLPASADKLGGGPGGSFLRPLPHIPLVQRQGEEDLAGTRSAAAAVSSVLSLTSLSDDDDGDDGGAVRGLGDLR